MDTSFEWYKVADDETAIAFSPGHIAAVQVNGRTICIGRYQNKLFAFAHKCPHAGGIMADGRMDAAGNVICPVHGYRFNVSNGRNTSGEGYYLKHWPVEQRTDGIFVRLEKISLS